MVAVDAKRDEVDEMPPLAHSAVRRAGTWRPGRARRRVLTIGVLVCGVCGFAHSASTETPFPVDAVLALDSSASRHRNDPHRATSPGEVGSFVASVASRLEQRPATEPAAAPPLPDAAERRTAPGAANSWLAVALAGVGLAGAALIGLALRRRAANTPRGDSPADPRPTQPPRSRAGDGDAAPRLGTALLDFRTGAQVPIASSTLTIGRDGRNGLVLPSKMVSANHARIEFREGQFWVIDLQSTNGTFVNGRRISEPTVVENGDRIDFDAFRFRFVHAGGSVEGAAVRLAPVPTIGRKLGPARRRNEPDDPHVRPSNEIIENHASTHRLVSCFVHRGRLAIERCSRCERAGCEKCVTITDEGPLCRECAVALSSKTLG